MHSAKNSPWFALRCYVLASASLNQTKWVRLEERKTVTLSFFHVQSSDACQGIHGISKIEFRGAFVTAYKQKDLPCTLRDVLYVDLLFIVSFYINNFLSSRLSIVIIRQFVLTSLTLWQRS